MTPTEYRTIRKQLGLTQAGLAALLGETRETVSKRERLESIAKRDEFAMLWVTHQNINLGSIPDRNDQSKNGQPVSVGSTGGSEDFLQENHDKLCALSAALKHLIEVIEVHEIESLSCDRDGNEYCDCLHNAATEAKRILPNSAIRCHSDASEK